MPHSAVTFEALLMLNLSLKSMGAKSQLSLRKFPILKTRGAMGYVQT